MKITEEQKKAANETDLVSYLESKGFEFQKTGHGYKPKIRQTFSGDMSSLSIFENRKGWKRWSTGEHGGDAISFLQINMGMSFQEAVQELTSGQTFALPKVSSAPTQKNVPEDRVFKLPKKCEGKYSRAFAYLNKTRCIDPQIITAMIAEKKIYQDDHNNVVFVGYNEDNKAAFACVRSTNTNIQFRGDCGGSDKRYSFSMDGKSNSGKLYVFESPIDLLSHATMANKITKKPEAWQAHSRISLAGTSDVALEHYLKSHPEVKEINFVLDNDQKGRMWADSHTKKYAELGYKTVNHVLKHKDMNDELKAYINKPPPTAAKKSGMKL